MPSAAWVARRLTPGLWSSCGGPSSMRALRAVSSRRARAPPLSRKGERRSTDCKLPPLTALLSGGGRRPRGGVAGI
eukprot:9279984-Pyramimonas_sp.AAC.1